jgi:hypothetical protein
MFPGELQIGCFPLSYTMVAGGRDQRYVQHLGSCLNAKRFRHVEEGIEPGVGGPYQEEVTGRSFDGSRCLLADRNGS